MFVIEATNVRDALYYAMGYLIDNGNEESTRIGRALVAPGLVTIHYKYPKQHVLLNSIRDANPFFHLMEAMWMLAGRDDGAFLDFYVKDFSQRFAKDGVVLDAYGHRWKYGYAYNQLNEVIDQLRKDRTSRQVVLQMWGAGRDDLRAYSSKPCNLSAVFRIQERGTPIGNLDFLDMTVFNRSNDLIWGCCGANAVHFPILQEYLAGKIGVELGEYWQVTNNLHLYKDLYQLMQKRANDPNPLKQWTIESYGETRPLMIYPMEFNDDLKDLMMWIDEMHKGELEVYDGNIGNPFLVRVVMRMAMAHALYKAGKIVDALDIVDTVEAEDWRMAGRQWLERRNVKR